MAINPNPQQFIMSIPTPRCICMNIGEINSFLMSAYSCTSKILQDEECQMLMVSYEIAYDALAGIRRLGLA